MEPRRTWAAALSASGVVVGVLGLMLVVTWAATSGPSGVLTGDGLDPVRISVTPTPTPTPEVEAPPVAEPPAEVNRDRFGFVWWVRALAYVLEAAGLVLVLALLGRVVLHVRRRYRDRVRREPPVHVPFEALVDPETLAEVIRRDAGPQRDVLAAGTPRNGVVACWGRFEDLAARSGLPRRTWETSSEFTVRLLGLIGADSDAVTRLAALYREARFSEHDMSEDLRVEALESLGTIHATVFPSLTRGQA